MALSIQERKALGAYYTSDEVASALVEWAVRGRDDLVLDPSFGGGAFLHASQRRLTRGLDVSAKQAARRVFGADLSPDPDALAGLIALGVPAEHFYVGNFFRASPDHPVPQVDAVVGNPPYIRYHGFTGEMRDSGLNAAARVGVKLSKLCSSWAPFLVHSVRFVRDHGRLAMVLPGELMHAQYSRNVLRFLCSSFSSVTAVTVTHRLFGPHTLEESILLLAEDKGGRCSSFSIIEAGSLQAIQEICSGGRLATRSVTQEEWALDGCWLRHLVPAEALALYDRLFEHDDIVRLGDVASVDVGVVTGCNDFFMLTDEEADRWGVSAAHRVPAVGRAAHLIGLQFTSDDFASMTSQKKWMLRVTEEAHEELTRYLADGRRRGVHTAYKCRLRPTWYSIPHIYAPSAFLTYMTNTSPRLVSNPSGVTSTNTLHRVKVSGAAILPLLQVGFTTTLAQISAELVGRSYGGGVLKLEPSEAERIVVPLLSSTPTSVAARWLRQIDGRVRAHDWSGATELADTVLLKESLGLGTADLAMLRDALRTLRARRLYRAKRPPCEPDPDLCAVSAR